MILWTPSTYAQANEKIVKFKIEPAELELQLESGQTGILGIIKINLKRGQKIAHFTLNSPNRLVIDVYRSHLRKAKVLDVKENEWLSQIRLGIHSDKARVVFDLKGEEIPVYLFSQKGNEVTLKIAVKHSYLKEEPKDEEILPQSANIADNLIPSVTPNIEPLVKEDIEIISASPLATKTEAVATSVVALPSITPASVLTTSEQRVAPIPSISNEIMISGENTALKESENIDSFRMEQPAAQDSVHSGNLKSSASEFSLSSVLVYIEPDIKPTSDIQIRNISSTHLKLTSSIFKEEHDNSNKQKWKSSNEVSISPKIVSLKPGEERSLRILSRTSRLEDEEMFKVIFRPFSSESEEVKITPEEMNSLNSDLELEILLQPKHPESQIAWEVHGDQLVLSNLGNVGVILDNGKICYKQGKSERCHSIKKHRVLPQSDFRIAIKDAVRISFMKRVFEQNELLVIEL